jgi:uncharacterized protein (PEP-CTERM system associated)
MLRGVRRRKVAVLNPPRRERRLAFGRILLPVSALVVACIVPVQALAAEWVKSGAVSVGAYATDNVCRSPSIQDADTVGTFRPSVFLKGTGARAEVSLRAAADYNSLADSGLECPGDSFGFDQNREAWLPRLNARAEVDAIRNWLAFDANARATQNAVNPFAPGGDETSAGLGNTNIVYSYGAGATLDRNLPGDWRVFARYVYEQQFNSLDSLFGDNESDRARFSISTDPLSSRLSYGIRGDFQEVTFAETAVQPEFTNRLSRAEAYAALRVIRDVSLEAMYGYEDNAFLAVNEEVGGSYWDVGLRWQPVSRISLAAGYGERFFGNTPRASISYRHKRTSLEASYVRDLRFPRNIRVEDVFADSEPAIRDAPPIGGEPLDDTGLPTFVGQSPVLNEQLLVVWRFTGRRTTINLRASDSYQTQASTGQEAKFQIASLRVARRVSPSIEGDVSFSWRRNERVVDPQGLPLTNSGFEESRLDVGLTRAFNKRLSLSLRYRYMEQSLTNTGESAEENRLSFNLNYRFL